MDLNTLTGFIGMQLDNARKSSLFYCPMKQAPDEHKQTRTSTLLGTCWHNTRELKGAITADCSEQAFHTTARVYPALS